MSNEYGYPFRRFESDLVNRIKNKFQNLINNSTIHTLFHINVNEPKKPWVPKSLLLIAYIM